MQKDRSRTGGAKARYIMDGAFLSAGKTTAVGKLAWQLTDQGLRMSLITNDQGRKLVGTAMLRSQGPTTLDAQLGHLEHFRPGKPAPTHCLTGVAV